MQQITGSIVLSKLQINNDKYHVVSSAEDIARFKIKKEGAEVYETSPQNLVIELYKEENGQANPVNFKDDYNFYLYGFNYNFSNYITFVSNNESNGDNENSVLVFDIQRFVQDKNLTNGIFTFIFEYVLNNSIVVSKQFQIRDGVSQDLAQFNITAAAINQSIGKTAMSFTEDGLEIIGGGFAIKEPDGIDEDTGKIKYKQLLGFETKNIGGQDVSKFTMKGTVYAEDGEFTGEIHATDATFDKGTIGGFNIADGKLVSLGKILENNKKVSAIELDGGNGKIIAHSIELGDNATIKNQIKLGSAYLKNPDNKNNNREFIRSGNILIKDDGTASFGEIFVNGSNSEISGNTWSIGKDYASFSNINVSGSIETAVFKTNSVQAAGGAMIFRPSYKVSLIEENGNYLVQFEDKYEGALGNTIQVVFNGNNQGYTGTVSGVADNLMEVKWDNEPKQTAVSATLIDYGSKNYTNPAYNYPAQGEVYYSDKKEENKIEELSEFYSSFSHSNEGYLTCADLQHEEGDFLKSKNKLVTDFNMLVNSIRSLYVKEADVLIGINTGRTKIGVQDSILPRGLTLTELGEASPRLYLGDLNQIGPNYSGYGLYADNVFLNGSLTTKTGEGSYAGVNTLNGVTATAFDEQFKKKEVPEGPDKSKIVFWAGAGVDSVGGYDITKAYFQVTEAGSLYAQRAKLEDTLLVGGIIKAAEIHTAELHGKDGALSIYDGTNGIQFKKGGNQNPEQVIFSINTGGLAAGDKNFINIDEKQNVNIVATQLRTANDTNHLSLETIDSIPALKHTEGTNNCGFYFETTSTVFKMGDNPVQSWTAEETKIYNSFELDSEGCNMRYTQESNGYNLYIVTSKKEENK